MPVYSPNDLPSLTFDIIIISTSNQRQSAEIHEQIRELYEERKLPVVWNGYLDEKFFDLRVACLRNCAEEIYRKNIFGNVAEVGVYRGDFAKYINRCFPDRTCYLFDTFAGFDMEDISDDPTLNKEDFQYMFGEYNEKMVLDKMPYRDNCVIRKGYFPDTADGIDGPFCFVSLDTDLYSPIYSGLEFFYPRLCNGGYIFVHDYNTHRFTGVKKAVTEYCDMNHITFFPLNDYAGSAIIMK